jgi:Uma2 family endonuclease
MRDGAMTTDTEAGRVPMVVRADWVPGPAQGRWTYTDYAHIPDDGHRYEIIDGVLYMPPTPNIRHQIVAGAIYAELRAALRERSLGRVYIAPADVVLPGGQTVQLDVFVVLNSNAGIVGDIRVEGTPDLVIEVASPGTVRYDLGRKLSAYARAGVPEYWFVDPYAETVEVMARARESYESIAVVRAQATLPSRVLPDLPLRVAQFFEYP